VPGFEKVKALSLARQGLLFLARRGRGRRGAHFRNLGVELAHDVGRSDPAQDVDD